MDEIRLDYYSRYVVATTELDGKGETSVNINTRRAAEFPIAIEVLEEGEYWVKSPHGEKLWEPIEEGTYVLYAAVEGPKDLVKPVVEAMDRLADLFKRMIGDYDTVLQYQREFVHELIEENRILREGPAKREIDVEGIGGLIKQLVGVRSAGKGDIKVEEVRAILSKLERYPEFLSEFDKVIDEGGDLRAAILAVESEIEAEHIYYAQSVLEPEELFKLKKLSEWAKETES